MAYKYLTEEDMLYKMRFGGREEEDEPAWPTVRREGHLRPVILGKSISFHCKEHDSNS